MDKRSLGEWGWIIVIVLILAFIIAFASPFGTYIVTSVKGLLFSFGQTADTGLAGLTAPDNLQVNNDVFSFDPVSGATGYKVSIAGGTPFDTTDTSTDISDKLIGLGGEVEITVWATKDTIEGPSSSMTYLVPGLYETGSNYTTLITPWSDMVANGNIVEDGKLVYGSWDGEGNDPLAGDLAIKSGIETIDYMAFSYFPNLTGVYFPDSVVTIDDYAFLSCSALKEIKLSARLYEIGTHSFANCTALIKVEIPDSVVEIGVGAFANCPNLTTVKLSNSLTTAIDGCFSGCSSLQSIVFPEGITNIGGNFATNCTSLTSVAIPVSVKTLNYKAFSGCSSLTTINYEGTISEWNAINKDGSEWDADTGNYTIYCTDGNIAKS